MGEHEGDYRQWGHKAENGWYFHRGTNTRLIFNLFLSSFPLTLFYQDEEEEQDELVRE